tara:strand:+ start:54 stop:566 length:513 start_codon:yes stop_codon:yes gene_type:complete
MSLEQNLIKELFEYRDGTLYNKITRGSNGKINTPAGCVNGDGRHQICIQGVIYKTHRLIFLLHNGWLPKCIDHIDGNQLNNKIENLRPATHSENMWNVGVKSNNTSGEKGVGWDKIKKRFVAYTFKNGKKIYASPAYHNHFDTAVLAVRELRERIHGDFLNNSIKGERFA